MWTGGSSIRSLLAMSFTENTSKLYAEPGTKKKRPMRTLVDFICQMKNVQ